MTEVERFKKELRECGTEFLEQLLTTKDSQVRAAETARDDAYEAFKLKNKYWVDIQRNFQLMQEELDRRNYLTQ